jgi:glycosyltransferase involved in cell wall biosynthesis
MKIMLYSPHVYPASGKIGAGQQPLESPSRSSFHVHDILAKGLAERGHDVLYLLPNGAYEPLPPGITLISDLRTDVDIVHTENPPDDAMADRLQAMGKPWVTTCHLDLRVRGRERMPSGEHWIFVSRTLAASHDRQRFVLNGLDPADYAYSESKDEYVLFMSTMDWGFRKGLDVAVALSKYFGLKLVVAGTGKDHHVISQIAELCKSIRASYVGDVRGGRKAELLAGATALLYPTKVNEAFGLPMVEAMMSGTPVICSDRGACPEIVSAKVGFVCRGWDEYVAALSRIGEIQPRQCRETGLREYHYARMSQDYITEYERELGQGLS